VRTTQLEMVLSARLVGGSDAVVVSDATGIDVLVLQGYGAVSIVGLVSVG
jgi:hypothetical protein